VLDGDQEARLAALRGEGHTVPTVDALLDQLAALARPGDHVVFMSNGGFEGAPRRMQERLRA
jgi:UDP-N-acetylmuramate: L-alanyl-gamma-D-glutamyl-meso-diaminopimelate ligase